MFNLSTANKLYNIREDGILLYFLLRNNLIEWLSPTSAKLREIKQIGSKLSKKVSCFKRRNKSPLLDQGIFP